MIYIGILLTIVFIVIFMTGFLIGLKYSSRETVEMRQLAIKHLELFKLAVKWIKDSEKITDYISAKGHKKIGIYGMSYLGDCLVDMLKKKGIAVVYGIDRNTEKIYNPYIPIYHIEDEYPMVDALIVTTIASFQQIKHEMECRMDKTTDIVSLESILHM